MSVKVEFDLEAIKKAKSGEGSGPHYDIITKYSKEPFVKSADYDTKDGVLTLKFDGNENATHAYNDLLASPFVRKITLTKAAKKR